MVWLQQLTVTHCRVIRQCDLELAAHVNVFMGGNASGKSSLVEALSVLSRGRSFRTPRSLDLITHGEQALVVAGRIRDDDSAIDYPVGIAKQKDGSTRIRINHADVNQQAELTRHLPLTVIHPESVELITGSPQNRRSMLDWIAFYCEADFHQDWKNYQRILKQRNACLRDTGQHYALPHWTEQLVNLQPRIQRYRQQALGVLESALQQLGELLTHTGTLGLRLSSGFPATVNSADTAAVHAFLKERREQELRQGISLYGAHRGDLQVTLDNEPAARIASRGQLKLLGIALLLAQSEAITQDKAKRGMIAIDDLASELDEGNQQLLYQVLKRTRQQLIITGTRPPPSEFLPADTHLFHVEQGQVRRQDSV